MLQQQTCCGMPAHGALISQGVLHRCDVLCSLHAQIQMGRCCTIKRGCCEYATRGAASRSSVRQS